MLFIRRLFNKKTNPIKETSKDKVMCSLNIELLEDTSIDLSIELHNIDINNENHDIKANNIAAFLHLLNSGGLSTNIANIMVSQIGSHEKYNKFIDTIIKDWVLYQIQQDKTKAYKKMENPVIKPTEVFSRYYQ